MKKPLLTILAGLALSFTTQAQKLPLDSGLTALYHFDGDLQDASGNGHHGKGYGLQQASGHCNFSNTAFYFDGTSSYVEVPSHADFNSSRLTLAFWVKHYSDKAMVYLGKSVYTNATQEQFSVAYNNNAKNKQAVGVHWGLKATGYCHARRRVGGRLFQKTACSGNMAIFNPYLHRKLLANVCQWRAHK